MILGGGSRKKKHMLNIGDHSKVPIREDILMIVYITTDAT